MYNLTVDKAHTFYVGEGQWLVHNTCGFQSTQTGNNARNARILRGNIEDGDVLGRFGHPGDAAHHIVPSTDLLAQPARDILDLAEIDINSQENGLWLNPNNHYITYPKMYIHAVNELVEGAYASGGSQAVEEILQEIARDILSGMAP